MTSGRSTPRFRGARVDLVIDVRSRLEFWMGHLPGAVCIPAGRLPDALAARDDITSSSRILVYCASGTRSATAAATLRTAGYANVVDGGALADARRELTT